jgi:hypothetical protein
MHLHENLMRRKAIHFFGLRLVEMISPGAVPKNAFQKPLIFLTASAQR